MFLPDIWSVKCSNLQISGFRAIVSTRGLAKAARVLRMTYWCPISFNSRHWVHCCPVKLTSKAKIMGKLRFRFLSRHRTCNGTKTALHYCRRGWGHASLFGRACAQMQKRRRCRLVKIALLTILPCCCRAWRRAQFFYRTAAKLALSWEAPRFPFPLRYQVYPASSSPRLRCRKFR